jgi:hypothetical protein
MAQTATTHTLAGVQHAQPLVPPAAVLAALCEQWAHVLPRATQIPRHAQLSAITAIWLDLSSALAGLQAAGLIDGSGAGAASGLCFDLRHFKQALMQLAFLSEQAAEQCTSGGASAGFSRQLQEAVLQSGDTAPAAVPQTPCTPAAGLSCATPGPGSSMTPHGLGGRSFGGHRLPLRTVCLLVVEVLCRCGNCLQAFFGF